MAAKLLLMSVVIMTVAIPVIGARGARPKLALKRTLLFIVVFNLFYLFAVRYIYPHLL